MMESKRGFSWLRCWVVLFLTIDRWCEATNQIEVEKCSFRDKQLIFHLAPFFDAFPMGGRWLMADGMLMGSKWSWNSWQNLDVVAVRFPIGGGHRNPTFQKVTFSLTIPEKGTSRVARQIVVFWSTGDFWYRHSASSWACFEYLDHVYPSLQISSTSRWMTSILKIIQVVCQKI